MRRIPQRYTALLHSNKDHLTVLSQLFGGVPQTTTLETKDVENLASVLHHAGARQNFGSRIHASVWFKPTDEIIRNAHCQELQDWVFAPFRQLLECHHNCLSSTPPKAEKGLGSRVSNNPGRVLQHAHHSVSMPQTLWSGLNERFQRKDTLRDRFARETLPDRPCWYRNKTLAYRLRTADEPREWSIKATTSPRGHHGSGPRL
mmetsp:Transcript_89759/g.253118  ORF Transcript_89759/g.253118 Transcript_89759/m.253118 type:complete len:203 (+) Transcript_89759:1134-1742(+)